MDTQNPKQQLVERLKAANNVLVTVSSNPSVDQLSACIGLTLLLNKQGKHATAVFSGEVPSTLEFLQPDATLEKTTDSLRDFIISLDKSKADKLRYKVEDRVVKIFITPYRTSLSADDLEFSQGDFNVDVVVALGVREQKDLDNAITAHGRILHDATVSTVNISENSNLGSINWQDASASSLCELIVDLGRQLGKDLMDNQIATALLTGIVAETSRFSNEKTTPQTMSVSAELMSAGANQQLVASKLEGPSVDLRNSGPKPVEAADQPNETKSEAAVAKNNDGMLEIDHPRKDDEDIVPVAEEPMADSSLEPEGTLDIPTAHAEEGDHQSRLITEPPKLGGTLTANSTPESYEPTTDPLSLPDVADKQMLSHNSEAPMPSDETIGEPTLPSEPAPTVPAPEPTAAAVDDSMPSLAAPSDMPTPPPAAPAPMPMPASEPPIAPPMAAADETLSELEQEVQSTHTQEGTPDLDAARNEVMSALSSAPEPTPPPIEALNAQPIDLATPSAPSEQVSPGVPSTAAPSLEFDPNAFGVMNDPEAVQPAGPPQNLMSPIGPTMTMPLPPAPQAVPAPQAQPTVTDPTAPPPVPPPIPFQFGGPQQQ